MQITSVVAMGQNSPALADLREAVAQDPTAACYLHCAQAHRMAGDRTAARTALHKAQASGLIVDLLHPLERPAYRQLRAELDGE